MRAQKIKLGTVTALEAQAIELGTAAALETAVALEAQEIELGTAGASVAAADTGAGSCSEASGVGWTSGAGSRTRPTENQWQVSARAAD